MRRWASVGAVAGLLSWVLSRYYTTSAKMGLAPVVALSHGGGPMPLLGDPDHKDIVYSLKHRIPKILSLEDPASRPKAILLITAHWSTQTPYISSGATHSLLYDYYGFPPEAYEVTYPAPGAPAVAAQVAEAMTKEGLLGATLDPSRGWDHGVFIPLALAHPAADVPIVQMSVLKSEDPATHLRMGRALRSLREENIAIVGSGFASFHNLRAMMAMQQGAGDKTRIKAISQEWNAALTAAVTATSEEERWKGLKGWRKLPGADVMHPPRAGEHFMPLIVCAGAAGDGEETRLYKDDYLGVDIYTYYWGADQVE